MSACLSLCPSNVCLPGGMSGPRSESVPIINRTAAESDAGTRHVTHVTCHVTSQKLPRQRGDHLNHNSVNADSTLSFSRHLSCAKKWSAIQDIRFIFDKVFSQYFLNV